MTGSSSFVPFLASWVPDYALSKNAILIMPNYRLLPEARGTDILEDMNDFWTWVTGGALQAFVAEKSNGMVEIDSQRIWAHGESAGGYLSIQAGLQLPRGTIRVVSSGFPMLDWNDPWYTTAHPVPEGSTKSGARTFFNSPLVPATVVTSHLETITKGGSVVSAADPPERIGLAFGTGHVGRWREFLGEEEELYPMDVLERRAREGAEFDFPPLFIFHGKEDTAIPVEGTERFVEVLKRAGRGEGEGALQV